MLASLKILIIWGIGEGNKYGRNRVGYDKIAIPEFLLSRLWQWQTWVHIMYAGVPELTNNMHTLCLF